MSRIAPRRTSRVMGLRAMRPHSACCSELTLFAESGNEPLLLLKIIKVLAISAEIRDSL
jgi:hypothetical protein